MVTKSWCPKFLATAVAACTALCAFAVVDAANAATWAPTETTGTATTNPGAPLTSADLLTEQADDHSVIAVWRQAAWCPGVCAGESLVVARGNPAGVWSAPVQVDTSGLDLLDFDLALNESTGDAVIAYSELETNGDTSYRTRVFDSTGTLGLVTQIAQATVGSTNGEVAVSRSGSNYWFAWQNTDGSDQLLQAGSGPISGSQISAPLTNTTSFANGGGGGFDFNDLDLVANNDAPVVTYALGAAPGGNFFSLARVAGTWQSTATDMTGGSGGCPPAADADQASLTSMEAMLPFFSFICNNSMTVTVYDGTGGWTAIPALAEPNVRSLKTATNNVSNIGIAFEANSTGQIVTRKVFAPSFPGNRYAVPFAGPLGQFTVAISRNGTLRSAFERPSPNGEGTQTCGSYDPASGQVGFGCFNRYVPTDGPLALTTSHGASDPSGHFHMITSEAIGFGAQGESAIGYGRRPGFVTLRGQGIGPTTPAVEPITPGPEASYDMSLSASSQGLGHISWQPSQTGGLPAVGMRLLSAGGSWEQALDPSDSSREVSRFTASTSSDGSVTAVWNEVSQPTQTDAALMLHHRPADGEWSSAENIGNFGDVTHIELALNSVGTGWLAVGSHSVLKLMRVTEHQLAQGSANTVSLSLLDNQWQRVFSLSAGNDGRGLLTWIDAAANDANAKWLAPDGSIGPTQLLAASALLPQAAWPRGEGDGVIAFQDSSGPNTLRAVSVTSSGSFSGVSSFDADLPYVYRTGTDQFRLVPLSNGVGIAGIAYGFGGAANSTRIDWRTRIQDQSWSSVKTVTTYPDVGGDSIGDGAASFSAASSPDGREVRVVHRENVTGGARMHQFAVDGSEITDNGGSEVEGAAQASDLVDPHVSVDASGRSVTTWARLGALSSAVRAAINAVPAEVELTGPTGKTDDAHPTYRVATINPSSTVECRVDDSSWQSCSNSWSPGPLAGGEHRLSARATDPIGGTGHTKSLLLEVTKHEKPPNPVDRSIPGCLQTANSQLVRVKIAGSRALLTIDAREPLTRGNPLKIYARGSRTALKRIKRISTSINGGKPASSTRSPFLVRFVPKSYDKKGAITVANTVALRKRGAKAVQITRKLQFESCKTLFTASRTRGPVKKSYGLNLRVESVSKLGTLTVTLPKKLRKVIKGKRIGTLKTATANKSGPAEAITVSRRGAISTASGVRFVNASGRLTLSGLRSDVDSAEITLAYSRSVWAKAFPRRACGNYSVAAKFEKFTLKTVLRGKNTPTCLAS